ncbi:MAG: glycosyltransferase [Methylococcaceae bacterium]
MDISLIISAHNEEQFIAGCLDSVIENASARFVEIIVVDNASTDRTSEIASGYHQVRVIHEPLKGITYARQRGLMEAKGNLLAYIDADTRLPHGWFDMVENIFKEYPHIVGLSGPYRYYDGSWLMKNFLNAMYWIVLPIGYWSFGYVLIGGNFVAKKQALKEIGGFDKNISFYGEDTDIGRRLHDKGRVVYNANLYIYTSTRRFYGEGVLKLNSIYFINYLWIVLFHRPFSTTYKDIRIVPRMK